MGHLSPMPPTTTTLFINCTRSSPNSHLFKGFWIKLKGFCLLQHFFLSMEDTASNNTKKKTKKNQTPEAKFHSDLTLCSKNKDLHAAISLYDTATSQQQHTRLNQSHFNSLLYLCSNSVTDPLLKTLALSYGFRIYDHMLSLNIKPNEASITAVARLAAAKGDGDYALWARQDQILSYDTNLLWFGVWCVRYIVHFIQLIEIF